ncbi:hypothetical protein CDO52_11605 [Nocardiopsis gilva YIM 90087]|uniref:Uncharacterized protein n=2 Tax=Nocardiopsis TaxID=2013 RepID=A0A223S5C0_9ACTN|nr:hypothetical protein [Nocardiopsis gilva]ASU83336.1 hypothetical protein CDO52_11605 [Nocardiopsis gilva YIM 90087]
MGKAIPTPDGGRPRTPAERLADYNLFLTLDLEYFMTWRLSYTGPHYLDPVNYTADRRFDPPEYYRSVGVVSHIETPDICELSTQLRKQALLDWALQTPDPKTDG